MAKTFRFTASLSTGRVQWAPTDQATQLLLRLNSPPPGRPQDVDARNGDTFILKGVHAIVFAGESPFPVAPAAGAPSGPIFVYLADSNTTISQVVVADITPNSIRTFPFRCGIVAGGVIVGLDGDGDEIVVVSP